MSHSLPEKEEGEFSLKYNWFVIWFMTDKKLKTIFCIVSNNFAINMKEYVLSKNHFTNLNRGMRKKSFFVDSAILIILKKVFKTIQEIILEL